MSTNRRKGKCRQGLGIYLHIPFCVSKCPYCDFASGPVGESTRRSHLNALKQEIANSAWRGNRARTLFLGGGTPSELTHEELCDLMDHLRVCFDLSRVEESSIECNPGTAGTEKFRAFLELGFNRLSLGVQSFRDPCLQILGRAHSSAQAFTACQQARLAGFRNINLDLIFAIPGQSLRDWEQDLEAAFSLDPEHLSLYNLTLEPETEFGRRATRGELVETDEETAARMFEAALDRCANQGFQQYEISNFSRPGLECRHNLIYWRNEAFLGFGLGAASCVDGRRWKNTRSYGTYETRVLAGQSPAVEIEELPPNRALGEAIMLALRTRSGAQLSSLSRTYKLDSARIYSDTIRRLASDGLLEDDGDRIHLTRSGTLLADYVCGQFLV